MNNTSTKILALSNKFVSYCKKDSHLSRNNDANVIGDDIRYNLSSILTDIVLALFAAPVKETDIQSALDQYNLQNLTNYTYSYFFDKGWIRYINGNYVIPAAVRSNIWKVENPATFNRHGHPIDLEADTRALLPVLILLRENENTSIDAATLNQIVAQYSPGLEEDFFIRKNILQLNESGRYQLNHQKAYFQHLRNRIATNAWYKIMGAAETLVEFRKFLRFLDFVQAYPDELANHLPNHILQKIKELSLQLLSNESDLMADNEIRNSRTDEDHMRHYKLSDPAPVLTFDHNDPYIFAKQLQHYRIFDGNLFFLNYSRNAYHTAIGFIIDFDFGEKRFSTAIKLLKESPNPYIKAFIIWMAEHTYPEMQPYFLTDIDLTPLAFMLLDEQKVNEKWLHQGVSFDQNLIRADEIFNELWEESFSILLEQAIHSPHPADYAKSFAALLVELSHQTFSFNHTNYHRSSQVHQRSKDRYDQILVALKTARLALRNHYPQPRVKPLLSAYLLPGILDCLTVFPKFRWRTGTLSLPNDQIDLMTELLRLSRLDFSDNGLYANSAVLAMIPERICRDTYGLLSNYFTQIEIETERGINDVELMPAKRTSANFGIEILDMAYLLANLEEFGLIENLTDDLKNGLLFNTTGNLYDEQNREQAQKITVFLKLLLVGYLGLSERQDTREYDNLPVKQTLKRLQELITNLALTYNIDAPEKSLMDVFAFRQYLFTTDLYSQQLDALLYRAMNYFPEAEAQKLIDQYFEGSKELGKLFSAVNRINDGKIKELLTVKIKSIDCDEFIQSAFTVTELEAALLEVANSRSLFQFATPFLKAIGDHFEKRNATTPDKRLFLYRIKLLLALKSKDTEAIRNLTPPDTSGLVKEDHSDEPARKQFYLGLDQFYNYENYPEAIKYFSSINGQFPDNPEFAVFLYQARTLLDLQNKKQGSAQEDWNNFKKRINNEATLKPYEPSALAMDLLYCIWQPDNLRFDQIVNTLPSAHLYQEPLIVPVYQHYVSRNLPEVGYDYLTKALTYQKNAGLDISDDLEDLKNNAVTDQLIDRVRNIFGEVRNLPAAAIPKVLPAALNDKKKINEFILGEILNGLKIMRQKIKAVESIVKEDHYNDVFLATLRLKFPVFGWEIADQARTGSSNNGKDAGEADVVIRSSAIDIALLEALKMSGRNTTNLQLHINKCMDYIRELKQYYIVVYYHGHRNDFDNFVTDYKGDVAALTYLPDWNYNATIGFKDLNDKYENSERIYLGRTQHGTKNYELYHIVVDMSKKAVVPKAVKPKKVKATKPVSANQVF